MFAAGNNAQAVLEVLLDRGGSVSIRDRCGPEGFHPGGPRGRGS